ncbi:hypothetical protein TI04_07460 [Achromatium sp. WMS2]|nr:hypothetical protein TI04_07460 [Achromatium sp. WMS2]
MNMISILHYGLFLLIVLLSNYTQALDISGSISTEGRLFLNSPQNPNQHEGHNLSIAIEPEIVQEWDDGHQRITFKPFYRWDLRDTKRTHTDIRELFYMQYGDGWEIRFGLDKVFWGVTEALHLVDIINQTDMIENPDGEDKLGQPMLKLALERDSGNWQLFILPGFRERTFPGRAGRLRTLLPVDTSQAQYAAANGKQHVDFALRWSKTIEEWDVGLAHFHGTGRDPSFRLGLNKNAQPVLIPYYEIIDQTSLDAQYSHGNWLWKFESIYRTGQTGGNYFATTGGFERTWVGFRGHSDDLGILAELAWDQRGRRSTTPFNNDLFIGVRWTANDTQSTELLAGMITDWKNGSKSINLEASRRLNNDWKISIQARGWFNISKQDPLTNIDQDDYVEIELTRYY